MRTAFLCCTVALIATTACDRPAPSGEMPCVVASPAAIDSSTRAQLMAARDVVWRAYYAGDSARLLEILPERMVGMGQTRTEIIAESRGFAGSGVRLVDLTFTCDEFFVSGDVAVVYSNYVASVDRNGARSADAGRAFELFERHDGKWLNPSWHLDPRP